MKKFIIIILPVLIAQSFAQFYEGSRFSGIGVPYFESEIFRTFADSDSTTRLFIYNEILNDDLTFIKDENEGYISEFELILAIFDLNENQTSSKTIRKTVKELNYDQTNNREKKIFINDYFDLVPGNYEIRIQMNDLISNKTTNRKISINIEDFREKLLSMSDILFLDDLELDSMGTLSKAIPRVQNNFSTRDGYFFLYFNLYSKNNPVKVSLNYRIESQSGKIDLDTTIVTELNDKISSHSFRIDKKKFTNNKYNCIIELKSENENIEKKKNFSFYWIDTPQTQEDLSLAIRQMMHILPEDSLDKYRDSTLEQQQQFFVRFWAKKDPNPATKINELQEEYFRRVNYANREYSAFNNDGWRSDRGRILIKFGQPDDIERHPFELNSVPYIIWRYFALRKTFVFADKTGFGDYRLLPRYMDQEYR